MGTTVEFYSADPEEFTALFSSTDEERFFDKLKNFPVADFSFHLHLPHDLDRLCQSLLKQHLPVPSIFRNLFVKQLWYDGISESLVLISDTFATIVASLDDTQIEKIAQDWSADFDDKRPVKETDAYQWLIQLRKVAQDAVDRKKSLILHLVG